MAPVLSSSPETLVTRGWSDYALLDSGDGRKLERYGRYTVVRPEPQCFWKAHDENAFERANAMFDPQQEEEDSGRWRFDAHGPIDAFPLQWRHVRFMGRFTPFRHLAFFPEQAANWEWLDARVRTLQQPKILNLFGYTGVASHAGTTPMNRRRDAATAAAELALFAEARASADEGSVATVGLLEVPQGSINVVPGVCDFSLDLRAPTNAQRDAMVLDVQRQAQRIAERRRVQLQLEEVMVASAAPSDPAWQRRWEAAVRALGLPVFHLPSGAGHDAMKLHELLPQAMLFVRGGNAGISHNPLESVSNDDCELAVQALLNLLDQLAQETP